MAKTLSFTDVGKSCHCRDFFYWANMSFNAVRENKIPAKNSEFTVSRSAQITNARWCNKQVREWSVCLDYLPTQTHKPYNNITSVCPIQTRRKGRLILFFVLTSVHVCYKNNLVKDEDLY